jgi:hypothetical protein
LPRKSPKVAALQPKKRKFLVAFEETCCVMSAARIAHITRKTHYHWLRHDSTYATAFEKSKLLAGDVLEAECVRRAVTGWDQTVYFEGRPCGAIHRYDNKLLMFLLRYMLPERDGNQTVIQAPRVATPVQPPPKVKLTFVNAAEDDSTLKSSSLPKQPQSDHAEPAVLGCPPCASGFAVSNRKLPEGVPDDLVVEARPPEFFAPRILTRQQPPVPHHLRSWAL